MTIRFFLPAFCVLLAAAPARAIDIVFDYTYDTGGFFTSHPTAKVDLEAAAQTYELKLGDTLAAIAPTGGNTWSNTFFNPSSPSNTVTLTNQTIAQNAILVFVGAANFSNGSELGLGGPGGYGASGSQAWLNTVSARGQTGALSSTATDFGPWGGALAFSSTANWYYDANPATNESFGTQSDFYSVAIHELGHLLGLGTADSWDARVAGNVFSGPNTLAVYGSAVPTDSEGGHWAEGTLSKIYGTTTTQEAAMDPTVTNGSRKVLTTLDVAGLGDIGWMIVPEPSAVLTVLGIGSLLGLRRRRGRVAVI